jgi:HSP20 family protein
MAIMDTITALLPARRDRQERSAAAFDAMALRDDVDRWIQRFFDEPGVFGITDYPGAHLPNVHETDREIVVKMEVPGFDREDIDLDIINNELTISANRREERRDAGKDQSIVAARYARFIHRVPLPAGVDANRAEARLERGELTVRFPKTEVGSGGRRIPVKA